ncbi:MAG TPA: SGNH/GDSL hydrolase family protein [Solirubrobacteraceae bacterium]|jgi:lysophospholipase L1-like esterase
MRSLIVALLALALLPAGAQAKQKPHYYVSLGDSLAVGMQASPDGDTVRTNQGYADVLYKQLRKSDKRLRHVKLGCGGESTSTMLNGGICVYGGLERPEFDSQQDAAEDFLRHHRKQIKLVTLDIGANNFVRCASGGAINGECLNNGLARLDRELPRIARGIRKAAGGKAPIAGMTLYDPFWSLYLKGDQASRDTATLSSGLAANVRDRLIKGYGAGDMKIADVFGAFKTADQTMVDYQGQQVPRAVERICALTYMCASGLRNGNIHANPDGYKVIAQAFRDALK